MFRPLLLNRGSSFPVKMGLTFKASSLCCGSRRLRPPPANPGPPAVAGKWEPTASLRVAWQGVWLKSEQRRLLHQTVIQPSVTGIWKTKKREHKQQAGCHFASCWRLQLLRRASATHVTDHLKARCCYTSLLHMINSAVVREPWSFFNVARSHIRANRAADILMVN